MNMPLAEILDRIAVLHLKIERIGELHLHKEMKDCLLACDAIVRVKEIPMDKLFYWWFDLLRVHAQIWALESEIRTGSESRLPLEEVGRRTIKIRDLNRKRVSIKAKITDYAGGYKDVKMNHAPEGPK